MTNEQTSRRPLRLWPGVVIAVLAILGRFVLPSVVPGTLMYAVLGGVVGGLAVAVWWLLFSRARWQERIGGIVLLIAALFATRFVLHDSIAKGMMGLLFYIYSIPIVSAAFVAAVAIGRRLADGPRRAVMAAGILLACGAFVLLRTEGITGEADSDFRWRWTRTAEERLLAQAGDERIVAPAPAPAPPTAAAIPDADAKRPAAVAGETTKSASETATPAAVPDKPRAGSAAADVPASESPAPAVTDTRADWPGFRGPGRDGVVHGVRIQTDWTASPPVELWRRAIGPGWSSFAVRGDRFYTQEQRGEHEIVAAYKVSSGEPIWRHRDAARFWESNAGAGPRGTPTLHNGRVYTFGATGILNALDAATGAVIWSRNAASDTQTETPGWGFSSSPLVEDDLVIVAVAGTLAAYDLARGTPRWTGPKSGNGYSSPHRATIGGVPQIILLGGPGAIGVAPGDGTLLWRHRLPSGTPIVQPGVTDDGDVLVHDGGNANMRRLAIAHGATGWTAEERWSTIGLKPYFNDFVVHEGHAYGFDGSMLACIDLADGQRKWKGGRYGHGQLVVLPDQDLLLVLTEEGELALVSASPDRFTELARRPAIEGKTWNHPAMAGDVLLVRNDREMAAFKLSLASAPTTSAAAR